MALGFNYLQGMITISQARVLATTSLKTKGGLLKLGNKWAVRTKEKAKKMEGPQKSQFTRQEWYHFASLLLSWAAPSFSCLLIRPSPYVTYWLVEEFYSTQYQSGSFSLIIVGSGISLPA